MEARRPRLGVVFPQTQMSGQRDAVLGFATGVEEQGFDYLLSYDHVLGAVHEGRAHPLRGPYNERDPFHDPLILFSYLAGNTQRIEFATGVLVLPQRPVALVARQAADLAILTGRPFRLGVGVGWNPVEYESLGQDFDSRGSRLDEQIDVLRRLWSEPVVDFEGTFHRLDRVAMPPVPTEPIPIWIGGFAEPALRRCARVGDGFIFVGSFDNVCKRLERLHDLLALGGRSDDEIGAEYIVMAGTPRRAAERVRDWVDAGGTHAAIATSHLGLTRVQDHLSYLEQVLAEVAA